MLPMSARNSRFAVLRNANSSELVASPDATRLMTQARSMSDEALTDTLASHGINLDQARLTKFSGQFPSAELLAIWLIKDCHLSPTLDTNAYHWIWASIACLWERWCPRSPSFEAFDELVTLGFKYLPALPIDGCRTWCQASRTLQLLLRKFRFESVDDLNDALRGTYTVNEWTCEFLRILGELSHNHLEWASTRYVVSQQLERLYADAPTRNEMLPIIRIAIAESCFICGDRSTADRWYEICVTSNSDPVPAWISWCNQYLHQSELCQPGQAEVLARRGIRMLPPGQRYQLFEIIARVCEIADRQDEVPQLRKLAILDRSTPEQINRAA